jgi:hypothetical protein
VSAPVEPLRTAESLHILHVVSGADERNRQGHKEIAMNANTATVFSTVAATASTSATVSRGDYDEIISINGRSANIIISEFSDALPQRRVDFDRKGRGSALNHDLYGYDAEQGVAVVQVREAFRRRASHFMSTHKTYVLVGHGEITGRPFRHPVSSAAVRAAIRKDPADPAAAVRAAQRWMWGVTEKQLSRSIRQGDVLMVPVRGTPTGTPVEGNTLTIGGSHRIIAHKLLRGADGEIFADLPTLEHTKWQHDNAYAEEECWYEIRVADAAAAWDFSQQVGD